MKRTRLSLFRRGTGLGIGNGSGENCVVFAILGILAAVALPAVVAEFAAKRDVACLVTLAALEEASTAPCPHTGLAYVWSGSEARCPEPKSRLVSRPRVASGRWTQALPPALDVSVRTELDGDASLLYATRTQAGALVVERRASWPRRLIPALLLLVLIVGVVLQAIDDRRKEASDPNRERSGAAALGCLGILIAVGLPLLAWFTAEETLTFSPDGTILEQAAHYGVDHGEPELIEALAVVPLEALGERVRVGALIRGEDGIEFRRLFELEGEHLGLLRGVAAVGSVVNANPTRGE